MIMVQLIQKSFEQVLSKTENDLLNVLRSIICEVGIFEN